MDSSPKNEENEIEKLSRKIPALSDYAASLESQVKLRYLQKISVVGVDPANIPSDQFGPWAWGQSPHPVKKLLITETGNSNKQCHMGSSTTTCLTTNDDFMTWEDGLMTGTGVSRKEACSLRESLASPKSIMKVGTWNVRTMYRIGKNRSCSKRDEEI